MGEVISAPERRRDLIAYFVLTYALSWAIEIPIALSVRGWVPWSVPLSLHYLASFGPFVAAVVLTLIRGRGLRGLFAGLAKWRVARGYLIFSVVLPLGLFAVSVLVTRIVKGAWPDLRLLGQVEHLPYLGILPALGMWLLTFGLGEEVGWRGFALPRLQARRSALSASLWLGLLWAGWHLPAIFYREAYVSLGLLVVPMLLAVATVGSIVYTWLYNGTHGSLLMLVLYHGLFDFFSVWPEGIIGPGMLMTIVMVFYAVRAYKVYGPADLAPAPKQVI
jgi:membrane protease YdiL (CAAX protease family)